MNKNTGGGLGGGVVPPPIYAWYQENGCIPKGMQVYDFTGFKDEYARKKAERTDTMENEAQAAKICADWKQYAARQSPAAQPIQAVSLQDALDQAVYGNPAAQQQLKPKSLVDQMSDSILAGAQGQEQMDRYTASGMTLPSALVKERLAGAQSVVFGTPYQFGIKPDAQEGFTARPFINLYMTQLEELAKRDPLRGFNSQNLSQFQIMHDWLAETPAAQAILGAIGEIAVDPLTYIGADAIMGIADAVKAGKSAQALMILKDVEAAAQAERAAVAGTRALDTATDIARGADNALALNLGDDIPSLTKEGNPGAKVEDVIETSGTKTPGAGGQAPINATGAWGNPDSLMKSATMPGTGGVTPVGRAFQKHAGNPSRAGTFTGDVSGNAAKNTEQGAKYISNILSNPKSTYVIRTTKVFGEVLDVRLPDGTGARWSADGKTFIMFLEKYTPLQ